MPNTLSTLERILRMVWAVSEDELRLLSELRAEADKRDMTPSELASEKITEHLCLLVREEGGRADA